MTDNPAARCELCPRRCGVDRLAGKKGFCRAGDIPVVFRYGPHHGEEPPVSGTGGSGTVFFANCTLKCLYCQNYPWSQEDRGTPYDVQKLARVFNSLQAGGCHNINLVSPTPWLPWISGAMELARKDGLRVPVVYNTSGYERVETLRRYEGLAQVYLPDLRYADNATAAEASGARDYVEAARAAILEMSRQTGPFLTDSQGCVRSGVICRILVLPGHSAEAVTSLEWLAQHLGNGVAVSLMAQYVPAHRAPALQPWNRRITRAEYEPACEAMERLGFKTGWVQEHEEPVSDNLIGYKMPAGDGIAVSGHSKHVDETE